MKRNRVLTLTLVLAVFLTSGALAWAADSPIEAFKKMGAAAQKKDWGSFYDGCEKSTQQTLGQIFVFVLAMSSMNDPAKQAKLEKDLGSGVTSGSQPPKIDKPMFLKVMALADELDDKSGGPKDMFGTEPDVVEKEAKPERVVLSVKEKSKPTPEDVIMVKEEGAWKFFLANPFEQGGPGTSPAAAGAGAGAGDQPPAGTTPPAATASPDDKAQGILKKFFKKE